MGGIYISLTTNWTKVKSKILKFFQVMLNLDSCSVGPTSLNGYLKAVSAVFKQMATKYH